MNNKNKILYFPFIIMGLVLMLTNSCKKEEKIQIPLLTTSAIRDTAQTSATCGGNITSDGGSTITARGVCWSDIDNNPTIADSRTSDGTGAGSFTSSMIGLTINTTYYVRAYATNKNGTSYGYPLNFKTCPAAILSTETPTSITMNAAVCGGTIIFDYGSTITARGVCWSTSANPSIKDNKTIDGVGIGKFSSSITGLTRNNTYFVRAYAISSSGTSYGNQQSFITTKWDGGTVTDIDGNVYHTVTIGTQVWMVENLKTTRYRNGELIGTTSADITNEDSPKYQWPCNDDESKVSLYGRCYTWYVVADNRNICPEGWHVPSNDEWLLLYNYIKDKYGYQDGGNFANSMSATWGWVIHCDNVTNSSGFTALPAGEHPPGYFGLLGFWWSSTEHTYGSIVTAYFSEMLTCEFSPSCYTIWQNKKMGLSVRCVLD